jgi:hypothetical protein
VHEGRRGEIGLGGEGSDGEWRKATPIVERVGEAFEPDFFGEEDLGLDRGRGAAAGIAPADKLAVFDNVLEVGGIDDEDGT